MNTAFLAGMNLFCRKGVGVNLSFSNFSIKIQILIGLIPVLVVLVFLAFSSFESFKEFDRNITKINEITDENLAFLEIEQNIVELQRNVLVYTYVGYQGVIRKIQFLQEELEERLSIIRKASERDTGIKERYNRMLGHYNDHKKGFNEAIKGRNLLVQLNKESIKPLLAQMSMQISDAEKISVVSGNYRAAHQVSQVKEDLSNLISNIKLVEKPSDALPIEETRGLLAGIKQKSFNLHKGTDDEALKNKIEEFSESHTHLEKEFKRAVILNRTYLQLVNVVLAGKAAEMRKLSDELDELEREHTRALTASLRNDIKLSQKQFITLSFLAAAIGVLSSVLIAMGIVNPVKTMALTLSSLSSGNLETEIPGQKRKDEVGKMAVAANEFKMMARDLDTRTRELEEFSYRTSHDLRSPLVSSIGLLNLAQENIDDEDYDAAKRSMLLVKTSLTKLETLVQDILELAKTKNMDEPPEEVSVERIIDDALQKFTYMENFENLDIKKNLNFTGFFKTRKTRIMLILENLISNAVKYQDTQKDSSFLKISTFSNEGNIVFEIEDNGLGIPKKQQKHMFVMFKRFHPRVSFGSGLGLYMMKKSADILNGEILFEDTGGGSKFTLIIPK